MHPTGQSRAATRQRPSRSVAWLLVLVAILAIFAAGALGAAIMIYQSDLIMPGVTAAGVPLGGQSQADAARSLIAGWQPPNIALVREQAITMVPADQLGVGIDAQAMAARAHELGRAPERVDDLISGKWTVQVPTQWQVDQIAAVALLESLAPQVVEPPTDANIRLRDGRIEVSPAVVGWALDPVATAAALADNLEQVIAQFRLEVLTVPVEPALADVSPLVGQAQEMLSNRLMIENWDPITDEVIPWHLDSDIWGPWLSAELVVDPEPGLTWAVDQDQIATFLSDKLPELGEDRYLLLQEAIPAIAQAILLDTWSTSFRVYHLPSQHEVRPGETLASIGRDHGFPYPWLQEANPGLAGELRPGQLVAIPSPDVLLPLPVARDKHIHVSISQQRMWAYEHGAVKWEWPVSTGIESSPTSPGVFQVQTHEANAYAASWDLWMPAFMGIYRPAPSSSVMNGFHGFPTRSGSQLLWTGSLGRPVTYGCILLSTQNADLLYQWADKGVIVEIRP